MWAGGPGEIGVGRDRMLAPTTDVSRAVGWNAGEPSKTAGINGAVSPRWLRHAHGSHAIDGGTSLPEVQATLGHDNIATTSGYLHARPDFQRTPTGRRGIHSMTREGRAIRTHRLSAV